MNHKAVFKFKKGNSMNIKEIIDGLKIIRSYININTDHLEVINNAIDAIETKVELMITDQQLLAIYNACNYPESPGREAPIVEMYNRFSTLLSDRGLLINTKVTEWKWAMDNNQNVNECVLVPHYMTEKEASRYGATNNEEGFTIMRKILGSGRIRNET